jgi:hypothetical protein
MGLKTISPTDLMKVIRDGQIVCFDVTSYESWNHAQVPGAFHLEPTTYSNLTQEGLVGRTYKLTSEDAYTAADLTKLLTRVVGRELKVFEDDLEAFREALIANGAPVAHAPAMARYFAKVAGGVYEPTDRAARVLGRAPRACADRLEQNPPVHIRRT